jgi:hypothetical protein
MSRHDVPEKRVTPECYVDEHKVAGPPHLHKVLVNHSVILRVS